MKTIFVRVSLRLSHFMVANDIEQKSNAAGMAVVATNFISPPWFFGECSSMRDELKKKGNLSVLSGTQPVHSADVPCSRRN